jgi:hypothetical protein
MSKSFYYLDDLHVGQRFKSGTRTLDAAQIKAGPARDVPHWVKQISDTLVSVRCIIAVTSRI